MKLKKVTIIFIVAVALFIIIFNICKSPLEKKVSACWQYAWPYWKLRYIEEDSEEKYITIVYDRDWGDIEKENICTKKTCDALYEKLLNSEDSQYQDYVIDVYFTKVNGAESFGICNMTADLSAIKIHNNSMATMPLKTIVEYFPNASELYIEHVDYHNTIMDIKGFERLSHLNWNTLLSKEEKEYIYSLYPNCVIECLEEN